MARLPGRLGELAIRDVMTRDVVTLSESDTLARAMQVFQHEHITGAPVVNVRGELVGLISRSDLLSAIESAREARGARPAADGETPGGLVAERMTSDVVFVRDIAPLIEAARIMCVGHWHRVPVVDAYDKLCGIVSTMDILAALVNAADEPG
jgi:CBS domain-containing membrane protein